MAATKSPGILLDYSQIGSHLQDSEMQTDEKLAKYRRINEFLDEQEMLLWIQKAEMEEEVRKAKEEHMAVLSEGLNSLMNFIHMEEEKVITRSS